LKPPTRAQKQCRKIAAANDLFRKIEQVEGTKFHDMLPSKILG
jgi:hypothetical protein